MVLLSVQAENQQVSVAQWKLLSIPDEHDLNMSHVSLYKTKS